MIKFNLGRIMEEKNLTIQDVYEKTGISRNTISQMINKEPKGIQFETLDKLLNNLNLTVESLIQFTPNEGKPFKVEDVSTTYHEKIEEFAFGDNSKEKKVSRIYRIRLSLKNEELSSTNMSFPVHANAIFDFEDGVGIFRDLKIILDDTSMFYEFLSKYYAELLEDIENEIYEFILDSIFSDYYNEVDEIDVTFVRILRKSEQ